MTKHAQVLMILHLFQKFLFFVFFKSSEQQIHVTDG